MKNVMFVKYNNLRKPEFQISTTIYEEQGERIVEKSPCCKEALSHIQGMGKNCELLKRAHKHVTAAEPELVGEMVRYEFIPGKTLEEELQNQFDDVDMLIYQISCSLDRIYEYQPDVLTGFYMTPEYESIFGRTECFVGETATCVADVDLVFDNIMRRKTQWILLDYEWVLEFPVPVSFLRFRTAVYFYDRHNLYFSKWYSRIAYLEKVGIPADKIDIFDRMEQSFQEYVRGEGLKYYSLKKYEKKIIPFRNYDTLSQELEQRDASIAFLNEVAASKDEYIESLEQLVDKYHKNPLYRMYNGIRKTFLRR